MNRLQGNPTLERSLRPGWFIHWRHQTWRVVSDDKADPLQIGVENVATGEAEVFSLLQLLSIREGEPEPIFASTPEELQLALERRAPALPSMTSTDLPESLLAKADTIITVVQMVDHVILEKEKRAWLRGEEFRRTAATEEACSHAEPWRSGAAGCHVTTIDLQSVSNGQSATAFRGCHAVTLLCTRKPAPPGDRVPLGSRCSPANGQPVD
jgi:hypothetical protein